MVTHRAATALCLEGNYVIDLMNAQSTEPGGGRCQMKYMKLPEV